MWRIIESGETPFTPYPRGDSRIKRILRQKTGEGRFQGFGFIEVPPGGLFPRHAHPEREEIYYVTSGAGTLMVEDQEIAVKQGSVIYILGDVTHGLKNQSDKPLLVQYVTAFAD